MSSFHLLIFGICSFKLASLRGALSKRKPARRPPDLKSGVKKCPNLLRLCGFAIRSKGVCISCCWGITNPPVLIGRTILTADFKSAGTPSGLAFLGRVGKNLLYSIIFISWQPLPSWLQLPLFCTWLLRSSLPSHCLPSWQQLRRRRASTDYTWLLLPSEPWCKQRQLPR